MIAVARCPYRISLLGGGSDLDWFVQREEYGLSLGFSTSIYSHVVINKLAKEANFGILNYSAKETYKDFEEIAHPLIREVLKMINPKDFLELSSFGYASGGSGLGGSSSFVVALLSCLKSIYPEKFNSKNLAELACLIEIDKLKKPIGRQDQYTSSNGGISSFKYKKNSSVSGILLNQNQKSAIQRSINTLYLIPSGIVRKADNVLGNIKNDPNSLNYILSIRKIASDFIHNESQNVDYLFNQLNEAIQESWLIKQKMVSVMNEKLKDKLDLISFCPHHWIRLLGAGAGGYFLFSSKLDFTETTLFFKENNINNWIIPSIDEDGVKSILF